MSYTREQALLLLKYAVVSRIDGFWGAGDAHLKALEAVMALDPEDQILKLLYERLKQRSEAYGGADSYKAESVYRDEGKQEADAYLIKIKLEFGEDFAQRLWDFIWDYF